ncbi:MAG: glycosyltransferase family 4 protein [Bacillota bacterium]
MVVYCLAFVLSLLISNFVTPHVKRLALSTGAVDIPNNRRINSSPIPSSGGAAIYLAFIITLLLFAELNFKTGALILGGTFIFIVGFIDDIYELSPRLKLAGQILAAGILLLGGISIEFITNPLGGMIYLGYWGIPLTVFWVVGITNTVNLIDGLDGLAAGVSTIAVLTLFFVSLQEGQAAAALPAVILAGGMLGFLRFNFHPAEIFMGDSGSLFIGYLLAAISVTGALKSAATVTVVVPVLALGIPIFDTVYAIIRRLYNNRPVGEADHGHLHHRLLALGWTQTEVVLIVYGISFALGVSALIVNSTALQSGLILLFLIIVGLVSWAWRVGVFTVELPRDCDTLEKGNVS